MTPEQKIDHLTERVGAQRVWDVILSACYPGGVFIAGETMSTVIDHVETIEDEARDPDEDE